jgi:hypothetical protein
MCGASMRSSGVPPIAWTCTADLSQAGRDDQVGAGALEVPRHPAQLLAVEITREDRDAVREALLGRRTDVAVIAGDCDAGLVQAPPYTGITRVLGGQARTDDVHARHPVGPHGRGQLGDRRG